MKKVLMIAILMGSITIANAQDVIYFHNGMQQLGKVIQIGTTDVVYKKAENPEGPNYVANKSEISMIEYPNGYKEMISTGNSYSNSQQPINPVYSQPAQACVRPQVNVIVPAPRPVFYGRRYNYRNRCNQGGWVTIHRRW